MGKETTAETLVKSLMVATKPITVTVESLGGKEISIGKFKLKHMPIVIKMFNIVKGDIQAISAKFSEEFDRIKESGDEEKLRKFAAGEGETETGTGDVIFKIIENHLGTLAELLSLCTGLTVDEIQELEIDEAAAITLGVVMLNRDFFMERVLPMFITTTGTATL